MKQRALCWSYGMNSAEILDTSIGRAMTDIETVRHVRPLPKVHQGWQCSQGKRACGSHGRLPDRKWTAHTKGCGKFTCTMKGMNLLAIQKRSWNALDMTRNGTRIILRGRCSPAHGAGFCGSAGDHVKEHMHVDSGILKGNGLEQG